MATEDQVQIGDLFIVEDEVSMPEIADQLLNPLEAHTNNLMDVEQSVEMLSEAAATQDMYQLVAQMETSESIGVVQAVAEVAVVNASKQDKYPGAGQLYEEGKHQGVVLDDKYEDVGGFVVLKTQALLYKMIWKSYGHIASSKVLTGFYLSQVAVVSEILTFIVGMGRCHPDQVSSESIDAWEEKIKVAEKLEFNIGWLREHLEDIKISFAGKKKLQETETEWGQAKAHFDEAQRQWVLANDGLNIAKERLLALETKLSPLRMERQNFKEKCRGSLLLFDWGTSLSVGGPIDNNNSKAGPSTMDKDAMPVEEPIDNDYSKTVLPCTVDKDAMPAEDAIDNNSKAAPSVEKDAIQEEEAIDNNSNMVLAAASIPRRRRTLSSRSISEKRKSSGDGAVVGDHSEKKPKTSTDGCAATTSLSITDSCPMPSRSVSPEINFSAPTAKQVFTEDEIMAVLLEHPVITSQELADMFRPRLITKEDKFAFAEVMKGICKIHPKEDGSRWVVLIKKQNSGKVIQSVDNQLQTDMMVIQTTEI